MGSEIVVGGLHVPLEQTPFGPRVVSDGDDDLEVLRWLVNSALYGDIRGLADSIERGESRSDGTAYARPAQRSDDIAAAKIDWEERTGHELGNDVYAVGVQWRGRNVYLPRPVLVGLIRQLEAMAVAAPKPPGPWLFALNAIHYDPDPSEEATVRALEAHAAQFDRLASTRGDLEHEATIAAKRRFLLAELEQYGMLTGPMGHHRARWLELWHFPTLLGYQRAAISIGEYWSSQARRIRIGPPPVVASVLGANVSVDWFRFPVPTPPEWTGDDWLAFCERSLIDTPEGPGQDGELFVHQNGRRFTIVWRRDDAVHPAVVRASAR